jgi:hypothetical protein
MTPEDLELAKEGVKESVKQMFAPVQDVVHQLVGPSATEVGLMWGDFFRVRRLKNAVRLFQDVKQIASQAGFELKPVAPRLLLPILEAASLQDDEDLHWRWVALLTNAATSADSVHPSFIEILRQLAPPDARLLDQLYDAWKSHPRRAVNPWGGPITYAERERLVREGKDPTPAFQNLLRLRLVEIEYRMDKPVEAKVTKVGTAKFSPKMDSHYLFTEVAARFVEACHAPKKRSDA